MNIKAEIVAHSINQQGDKLMSVLCTFPRIILAEVNTHRMLSKNTSSSRAIPFNRMLEAIQTNPFIPIAWQKEHSGMQGTEYFTDIKSIEENNILWERARKEAIDSATYLNLNRITKQLANRLLEPFMWTTMLITGSEEGWDNFFKLRCPKILHQADGNYYKSLKDWNNVDKEIQWTDLSCLHPENKGQAEIHMMALAEAIWDARNESTPKLLQPGEWHIPFENKIEDLPMSIFSSAAIQVLSLTKDKDDEKRLKSIFYQELVKVSTAMAARTSYTVVGEEKGINPETLIGLHDRLITQQPPHSSPMEHCSRCMTDEEYYSSIKTSKYPVIVPKNDKGLSINGGIVTKELYPQDNILGQNIDKSMFGWCYNHKGFIPYRYLIDNNLTF